MQSKWNTKILNDHRLGSEEICICHITSFVLFKKWKDYCSNTTLTIFHLQDDQIFPQYDKYHIISTMCGQNENHFDYEIFLFCYNVNKS